MAFDALRLRNVIQLAGILSMSLFHPLRLLRAQRICRVSIPRGACSLRRDTNSRVEGGFGSNAQL